MIIRIPFEGFYESELAADVENAVDYYDLERHKVNYPATYEALAFEYFNTWQEETGFVGKFVKLLSPREYNFDTDQLMVEFDEDSLRKIKEMGVCSDEFSDWVAENCRSYDGFYSFIDPDLNHWPDIWLSKHYYAALLFLEHEDQTSAKVKETLREEGLIEIITTEENG